LRCAVCCKYTLAPSWSRGAHLLRLPCSVACPYRAGWKQHLHQDKNMSNILTQHIAHKRKSQEGYTLTHFIDCFLLGGCLLVHPLSTVWIIRVHSLGVRYPVACFPTGLFGVVGQVQELPTFDTNMCVHRQHTTLHSVFVQNLPEQLRIFEALHKGPDTLGNFHTRTPPTSSSGRFGRCVQSVLLCTEVVSTTRWTAGRLVCMVAVLTCSLLFNHVKWQHANRRTRKFLSTVGCRTLLSHCGF